MNNDLERFSEERLMAFINQPLNNGFTRGEQMLLARIATAAKQAKIAGFITSTGSLLENETQAKANIEGTNKTYQPLYASPQPAHTEQSEPIGKMSEDGLHICFFDDRDAKVQKVAHWVANWPFDIYTTPQPAHTEQDGWMLVPIEPTEAMKKSYYDSSLAPISKLSVTGYRAMLAAAPKPESE